MVADKRKLSSVRLAVDFPMATAFWTDISDDAQFTQTGKMLYNHTSRPAKFGGELLCVFDMAICKYFRNFNS